MQRIFYQKLSIFLLSHVINNRLVGLIAEVGSIDQENEKNVAKIDAIECFKHAEKSSGKDAGNGRQYGGKSSEKDTRNESDSRANSVSSRFNFDDTRSSCVAVEIDASVNIVAVCSWLCDK